MQLRDEVEGVLRGWDRIERKQGRPAVIDYDCFPHGPVADDLTDRAAVYDRLGALRQRAAEEGDDWVQSRVEADYAYLSAKLGERTDLATYLARTQGATALEWSADYIDRRRAEAIEALDALGIKWSASTNDELEDAEGRLTPEETADEIRAHAEELEPAVRRLGDTQAPFTLRVEEVDLDVYWSYWLDGAGADARLRINLRNAQFTKIRARQLALHEILGHALQGASYYHVAQATDVPWVRVTSVHAPQQVLLEGLAQALPYFITPHEADLMARTRLTLYTQLIRGQLHLQANAGAAPADCINYARQAVPFWKSETIADMLDDRVNNPQLRSYLWSYPAGMDWFARLSEAEGVDTGAVIRECYQAPLRPSDLASLWTDDRPI